MNRHEGLDGLARRVSKYIPAESRPSYARRYRALKSLASSESRWPSWPQVLVAVAHLCRAANQESAADRLIAKSADRHPDHLELQLEYSQKLLETGRANRAAHILTEFHARSQAALPARFYTLQVKALRETKQLAAAEAVLDTARTKYEEDMPLRYEAAYLEMSRKDWDSARQRWEEIARATGNPVPAKVLARLAVCHRELGDFDTARRLLRDGRIWHPSNLLIEVEAAQLALVEEDFPRAFTLWEQILETFGRSVNPRDIRRLGLAYRRVGDRANADRVLQRGRAWFPHHPGILQESAELAMAQENWSEAAVLWATLLSEKLKSGAPLSRITFPRRGSVPDWFERGWQQIARSISHIEGVIGQPLSAEMYRALGTTLTTVGLLEEAELVLSRGTHVYPADMSIRADLIATIAIAAHCAGANPREWLRGRHGTPCPSPLPLSSHNARNDAEAIDLLSDSSGFADLNRIARPHGDRDRDRVFLLDVERKSPLALRVLLSSFFSSQIIASRTRELSERQVWPEGRTSPDPTMMTARRLAQTFGETYEEYPYLPAGVLADATYDMIYHELVLFKPVSRLAADVAQTAPDNEPVFIECSNLVFNYLDGWGFSQFDLMYFYFELRRRGVAAILCRFIDEPLPTATDSELTFRPGVRNLRPNGTVHAVDRTLKDRAVIPAGLRSTNRVLSEIGDALVYQSGAVVKEFAYDRSFRQPYPISPGASIHPDISMLPTYTVTLTPIRSRPAPESLSTAGAVLGILRTSRLLEIDWLALLHTSLRDFFLEMATRCHAEVHSRGISEVNICDHLFPESALFADAVKRSGGRVILWPHSSNPVHVPLRTHGTFDEVHAITRSGVEQWRTQFPDIPAVHSPHLMLERFRAPQEWSDSDPLSVVVIGGRDALKNMPVVDRKAHESSYRRFFSGLDRARKAAPFNVYFKPRGLTGEHEMWLYRIVGDSARWEPVYAHPMRLQLPNMLFVSISFGTSALFEGLSRGIPGLIVRDFRVHDYTTIDPKIFLTARSDAAVDIVRGCAESHDAAELLSQQLEYFRQEIY